MLIDIKSPKRDKRGNQNLPCGTKETPLFLISNQQGIRNKPDK